MLSLSVFLGRSFPLLSLPSCSRAQLMRCIILFVSHIVFVVAVLSYVMVMKKEMKETTVFYFFYATNITYFFLLFSFYCCLCCCCWPNEKCVAFVPHLHWIGYGNSTHTKINKKKTKPIQTKPSSRGSTLQMPWKLYLGWPYMRTMADLLCYFAFLLVFHLGLVHIFICYLSWVGSLSLARSLFSLHFMFIRFGRRCFHILICVLEAKWSEYGLAVGSVVPCVRLLCARSRSCSADSLMHVWHAYDTRPIWTFYI